MMSRTTASSRQILIHLQLRERVRYGKTKNVTLYRLDTVSSHFKFFAIKRKETPRPHLPACMMDSRDRLAPDRYPKPASHGSQAWRGKPPPSHARQCNAMQAARRPENASAPPKSAAKPLAATNAIRRRPATPPAHHVPVPPRRVSDARAPRTPNPREPGLAGRRRGASAFLRATLIHKRHAPRTSVVSTWAHTRLFHALPTPVPPTAHLVIRQPLGGAGAAGSDAIGRIGPTSQ